MKASISIIIPAYNAAATIAETLRSLLAQTFLNWEAIVIDDGSGDSTCVVVKAFADQDARIKLISQLNQGVSAARNAGIGQALAPWLLFLDADDWIAPRYLETMFKALEVDAALDAVHCGWALVAPDGTYISQDFCPPVEHLFTLFAHKCAFVIHACVIRKSLVEAIGLFDASLKTCEDWDLWQRVARTGARFGAVREVLAFYRACPDSASRNSLQFCRDGLRIINQGHTSDPRVTHPSPLYADGQAPALLTTAQSYLVVWAAGLALGQGQEVESLLGTLQEWEPSLNPHYVADCLFEAALRPTCQPPSHWTKLWFQLEPAIDQCLAALEAQSHTPELAQRTRRILERLVIEHALELPAQAIGSTYAVRIEVTEPIPDLSLPESVERLYGILELEGAPLGQIELPVCDGVVTSYVLADAIAAEYAWRILGRFFEHTLYFNLRESQDRDMQTLHDRRGWTVFLQCLWGRSDWSDQDFYHPEKPDQAGIPRASKEGWLVVEVSEELPDVETEQAALQVLLTVGGTAIGTVMVPVKQGRVSAQALRVALTTAGGFELCRACVREGLLGQSLTNAQSLRDRLAAAVQQKRAHPPDATNLVLLGSEQFAAVETSMSSLLADPQTLRLGRRADAMGTSASRRASLPQAATAELLAAATAMGEPVMMASHPPKRVIYAPELLGGKLPHSSVPTVPAQNPETQSAKSEPYDRGYFESLFAQQADPWKYTHAYEQTKYEQTLSLLPRLRIKRALELACAEGHFTVQLAPRVDRLLATDISQIALDRAAERCQGLDHVEFACLNLAQDPLPGKFGLIVCSEVLYYIDDLEKLQALAQKIAEALEPGGYFLTAHANLVVDEPDRPGYDWDHPFGAKVIGETFSRVASLQCLQELKTPLYRIQLFQRPRQTWMLRFQQTTPKIVELPQPTPLPPHAASRVLWNGGLPRSHTLPAPVTTRLPILMYHRVAPTGAAKTARWRVTPDAFEAQLRYLRDAGFYSTTLEAWRIAMATRQPLPGRAVLITFDDGYLDFLTYAQPLLKRYGFSATVFLVADKIGQLNSWDQVYGEAIALLDWAQIRQLQAEGIEFGSHAASHRPLTGLSVAQVVQEGVRSRAILHRELGVPIRAFAYPYGDCDRVVQHLIGACGYVFGLTCQPDHSQFHHPLLALPRIEVCGSDSFGQFVAKLKG